MCFYWWQLAHDKIGKICDKNIDKFEILSENQYLENNLKSTQISCLDLNNKKYSRAGTHMDIKNYKKESKNISNSKVSNVKEHFPKKISLSPSIKY